MGVPAFFRWLTQRYKRILVRAVEDGSSSHPLAVDGPNPNGVEWDNLYLDMNGIIHPCAHPEDEAAPATEREMFEKVFAYIDRIVALVRPRRLIYMAIDGVAPRAKANQQRARRFRTAQEAQEEFEMLSKAMVEAGKEAPMASAKAWDSNVITPGTPFMASISLALRYYIALRLNTAPGWKGVVVMLSDSNVPGEGEHKIMEFIRSQRMSPGYNPNLNHMLYGTDADLIMLALATHEPHFFILREHFAKKKRNSACFTCGRPGHISSDCPLSDDPGAALLAKRTAAADAAKSKGPSTPKPYDIVDIGILREYLLDELHVPNLPFRWDPENVLDDFVFLCFFVGNDFLPHLPSLRIREGALNKLIRIYKDNLPRMDGYLTDNGELILDRVQVIIDELGRIESNVFKQRKANWDREKARRNSRRTMASAEEVVAATGVGVTALGDTASAAASDAATTETAPDTTTAPAPAATDPTDSGVADMDSSADSAANPAAEDEVRLWEEGWKKRHYKAKFGVDLDKNVLFQRELACAYVKGLVWVFRYYYQGCASWRWFYPYHYAPFASDLSSIIDFEHELDFELGTPFNPLTQLMAVLPPDSKAALPLPYQRLMTDEFSPLAPFYPTEFGLDLNGAHASWMAVVLLPFIDETRLLEALDSVDDELTDDERARNEPKREVLFANVANTDVSPFLLTASPSGTKMPATVASIAGSLYPASAPLSPLGTPCPSPAEFPLWPTIDCNMVVAAEFEFPNDSGHESVVLPSAVFPPNALAPGEAHQARSRGSRGSDHYHQRAVRQQQLAARHPRHPHIPPTQMGHGPRRGAMPGQNRHAPYHR